MSKYAFVQKDPIPPSEPPILASGPLKWLRENLFSSVTNGIVTVLFAALVIYFVVGAIPWFTGSVWNASSLKECRSIADGACFAVINERWPQFLFGFYPNDLYWRPVVAYLLLIAALVPVLWDRVPPKYLVITGIVPFIIYWLIWGGSLMGPVFALLGFVVGYVVFKVLPLGFVVSGLLGVLASIIWWMFIGPAIADPLGEALPLSLEDVPSRLIGGFVLTLILGVTSIAVSLPVGVLLALGRQSNLFVVKIFSVAFIEFIRGVPLITLLFVANVLLAYFLPPSTTFDLILRVLIMMTMFASAYIAEVIRGGLAALPSGQYEAADSLGLDYWQKIRLVIMPQALKISIPGIVNTFIGLFKDTTLVVIISMFDPLGVITPIRADADWNGIIWELYGFVALFFFINCFSMSRYSMYLERKLQTEHR